MAVYKVPQDVEAEDKLLGPFSFRQFIYLIIVAVSGLIGWGLAQVSIFLVAIPLPVMILFGILALPLRKDQPMETYLAAMIQFFLKPKRRLWNPDGTVSLVQITAPKVAEEQRTKNLSENEAINRLSYLAQIMDTRGWASRGVAAPNNTSLADDVAMEAEQIPDIMDDSAELNQSFTTLIEQRDAARREEMRQKIQQAAAAPQQPQVSQQPPAPQLPDIPNNPYDQFTARQVTTDAVITEPPASAPQPAPIGVQAADDSAIATPHFNPYPTIHQHVVQPLSAQTAAPAQQTQPEPPAKPSENQVSPDIIKLANNSDLSISTIAHEAHRLQEKQNGEEVIISLR
ncbi:MAG TPA: PrgI family protein [Candidatus Saccharimonadales bacterium]